MVTPYGLLRGLRLSGKSRRILNSNGLLDPNMKNRPSGIRWQMPLTLIGILTVMQINSSWRERPVKWIPIDSDVLRLGDEWNIVEYRSPEDAGVSMEIACSHSWVCQNTRISALVSFDQLKAVVFDGWGHWHELTYCYQGVGWKLESRQTGGFEDQGGLEWGYVTASFSHPENGFGTLFFSILNDDADPIPPPSDSIKEFLRPNFPNAPADFSESLISRFKQGEDLPERKKRTMFEGKKTLQIQVFHSTPQQLSEQDCQSLLKLHAVSCYEIRRGLRETIASQ